MMKAEHGKTVTTITSTPNDETGSLKFSKCMHDSLFILSITYAKQNWPQGNGWKFERHSRIFMKRTWPSQFPRKIIDNLH